MPPKPGSCDLCQFGRALLPPRDALVKPAERHQGAHC